MTKVNTFDSPSSLAEGFSKDLEAWLKSLPSSQTHINIALSGGSTPKILFELWARQFVDQQNSIDWSRVHFYWGDERCVPPEDSESNFGVARKLFLEPCQISDSQWHRVKGEEPIAAECERYENEIKTNLPATEKGLPQFDLIMLGMGSDGHTASIFPHESQFLNSTQICEVATHPDSGQKRITLTGPVLNAAQKVVFLITGESKAEVLRQVINRKDDFEAFPASHIQSTDLQFYLDEPAASRLS